MENQPIPEKDLEAANPELTEEWDAEANYPMTPNQVSAHSVKKVGWRCKSEGPWKPKKED